MPGTSWEWRHRCQGRPGTPFFQSWGQMSSHQWCCCCQVILFGRQSLPWPFYLHISLAPTCLPFSLDSLPKPSLAWSSTSISGTQTTANVKIWAFVGHSLNKERILNGDFFFFFCPHCAVWKTFLKLREVFWIHWKCSERHVCVLLTHGPALPMSCWVL